MRGRRPAGPEIVEQLHGSAQARQRLRVVLETLAGRLRLHEACQQLGIGPVRFHTLRQEVLEAALAALEPRPAGRPPRDDPAPAAALAGQVEDMATALEASRLREEVALILAPRDTPPGAGPGKKTTRARPRPGRPRKRRTGSG